MNKNICLVIVYNHRYEKNIELLEKIYKDRFASIYHLMPFYQGERENVISVYECSYQFQGYIAQGISKFYKSEYTDYLFIGDDLILSPNINQNNILEYLHIEEGAAFIPKTTPIGKYYNWHYERLHQASAIFSKYNGTNFVSELPSAEDIYKKMYEQGYTEQDFVLTLKQAYKCMRSWRRQENIKFILKKINHFKKLKRGAKVAYPVFCGYSDIFMIPQKNIKKVAKTLGVFAAMRLFVEIAIPTALKWNCEKVQGKADKGKIMWSDQEKTAFENEYMLDLDKLLKEWPNEYNYIHPVKISKWYTKLENI